MFVWVIRGQVEEDNDDALRFYRRMDFQTVFVDKGARRYDTGGVLLQNVRCTKLTMRKVGPHGNLKLCVGRLP